MLPVIQNQNRLRKAVRSRLSIQRLYMQHRPKTSIVWQFVPYIYGSLVKRRNDVHVSFFEEFEWTTSIIMKLGYTQRHPFLSISTSPELLL